MVLLFFLYFVVVRSRYLSLFHSLSLPLSHAISRFSFCSVLFYATHFTRFYSASASSSSSSTSPSLSFDAKARAYRKQQLQYFLMASPVQPMKMGNQYETNEHVAQRIIIYVILVVHSFIYVNQIVLLFNFIERKMKKKELFLMLFHPSTIHNKKIG